MRLLVYGGNQYGERRRVGTWPDEISPEVLQDTYGCSERYFSFGVGLLEASPFIIFRKIQAHNQRSYPLTVLLDPGEAIWSEFDWNGAHLLWTLFGEPESPGNNILREPETFHSEQHLVNLFESVRRRELIGMSKEERESSIRFREFWSGALLSSAPTLIGPTALLAGGKRPSIKEMYLLLQGVPLSLRCAMGWLVAGNLNHVKPFGLKLIIDEGKNEGSDSQAVTDVKLLREHGRRLIAGLETVSENQINENSPETTNLLRQPVFQWEKEAGILTKTVLDSLVLVGELIAVSEGPVIHGSDESEKRFERVIAAVREGGPFAEQIAASAHALLKNTDPHQLSKEETNFALLYGETHRLASSIKARFNEDAALSYFLNNRIYPSQAGKQMPDTLRLRVWQQLLTSEPASMDLPKILHRELANVVLELEDLKKLTEIAVQKSAESQAGLRLWQSYLDSGQLGLIIAECLQARALASLNQLTPTAITDYLFFGNDPGGELLNSFPPKTIGEILASLIDIYESSDAEDLRDRSAEWLSALAKSELRRKLSLDDKERLAAIFVNDWRGLLDLGNSFAGETPANGKAAKAVRIDEGERSFLVEELRALVDRERERPRAIIPDLDRLRRILGQAHLSTVIDNLYEFEPDLDLEWAPEWIYGWDILANDTKNDSPQVSATARNKFQSEAIRLYLTTNRQLPDVLPLTNFNEADLQSLIAELLYGGSPHDDEHRRRRFLELFERDRKAPGFKKQIQIAYADIEGDPNKKRSLLRRFAADQAAQSVFDKALNDQDRKKLDQSRREWAGQECDEVSEKLQSWLSHAEHSIPLLQKLKHERERMDQIDKGIFASAMRTTLEEIFQDKCKGENFASSHQHDEQLLLFLKPFLSSKQASTLVKLLADERHRREIVDIEKYVFGGTAADDEEFRNRIQTILSQAPTEASAVVATAIEKALLESNSQENLFRRLVMSSNKKLDRNIQESKATNLIFEHLPLKTQMQFFLALMKSHRDLQLIDNPVTDFAYTTLKKMLPPKGKGKAKQSGIKPTPLRRAVLCFMTLDNENSKYVKKQVASWLLGANQMFNIDKYLRDYEYKRLQPEGDRQINDLAEEPGVTRSFFAKAKAKARRFLWDDSEGVDFKGDED